MLRLLMASSNHSPARRCLCGAVFVGLTAAAAAHAGEIETDTGRRLADPIASLDAVWIRLDWDRQIGARDEGERQTLEVEPVFSFDLPSGARVVSRTRIPLVRLDGVRGDDSAQSGLGDVLQSLYYVPAPVARGGSFHWGFGLALQLPSAADDVPGREEWGIGPAVAATWMGHRWSWGAQLQHLVDTGGGADFTLVQPFVARELGRGWSSGVQVDAAYDSERDRLKGPLTLYARKAWSTRGSRTQAFDAGLRYWIDGPTEEPEWGARIAWAWVLD